MRRRFVYDGTGNAVELTEDGYARMHFIRPDVAPFRSMVDGTVIESRKQYDEHLKRNGYRVVDPSEVSHEKIMEHKPNYDVNPSGRRELIRRQIDAMTHKEFKAALQRDIDSVKWNSNY